MTTPDPTDRLREALARLQWILPGWSDEPYLHCPACGVGPPGTPHDAECWLAAALAAPAPDLLAAVDGAALHDIFARHRYSPTRGECIEGDDDGSASQAQHLTKLVLALIESRSPSTSREAGLDAETVRALREAIITEVCAYDLSIERTSVSGGVDRAFVKIGARLAASPVTEADR